VRTARRKQREECREKKAVKTVMRSNAMRKKQRELVMRKKQASTATKNKSSDNKQLIKEKKQ